MGEGERERAIITERKRWRGEWYMAPSFGSCVMQLYIFQSFQLVS